MTGTHTLNFERPNLNVATRFCDLLGVIRSHSQDPTAIREAALAWLQDGERQLMWTIEDQLVAASKAPPVWLTDPDKKLRIYMFGLPPTLVHYRDEIMSHLSRSMEGWGLDAHIEEHPLSVRGQTTFQISVKFKTLPGYEAASYIPIIVGDYPRQHEYPLVPDKDPTTPRPITTTPRSPGPLDASSGSHSFTNPPIAPSSSRDASPSGGFRDCRPYSPKIDIRSLMTKLQHVEYDAKPFENGNPTPDAPFPIQPNIRPITGHITPSPPVHKFADIPPSGPPSVLEEPDSATPVRQTEDVAAKNQEVRRSSPRRLYLNSGAQDSVKVGSTVLKATNLTTSEALDPQSFSDVDDIDLIKRNRSSRGSVRFYTALALTLFFTATYFMLHVIAAIRIAHITQHTPFEAHVFSIRTQTK